jgi:hypothetical protein
MCLKHWKLVPRNFQLDIWKHYKPGQEISKDPTNEYVKAAQRAIAVVIMAEQGLSEKQMLQLLESKGTP